jgi:hypothetical protein
MTAIHSVPLLIGARAHILPTICPQLQTSSVISGDELPLLERLFDLVCWAVIRVQS